MLDLEQYYEEANSGRKVSNIEMLAYIRSFDQVILWGGSYLGYSLGKCLQENSVKICEYWDMRADELQLVNGIKVNLPFTEKPSKGMLIIFCIGNTAIKAGLLRRLKENGYFNILMGESLFMGMLCPFDLNSGVKGEICSGTMTCRSMFCKRLQSIVKNQNEKNGLFLDNLTFMISTKCSLKCKYCVAYMNSYSNDDRRHMPCERVIKDIDTIFENVDAVGSVTVQGGEPFLHPDIDKILKRLLEKKNLGIVSVATNGVFRISSEQLDNINKIQDERLNIAFSGYYGALPESQMKVFYSNIELMKKYNIPHTVGVKMPEWTIPPTLWNRHYSEEMMKGKKENCKFPERCMQVMDGRLYPCLYSVSLHGIGVADYSQDYVDLDQDNLTEKIKKFIELPYYYSCGHCGGGGGSTNMAGEQGFFDFITQREGK